MPLVDLGVFQDFFLVQTQSGYDLCVRLAGLLAAPTQSSYALDTSMEAYICLFVCFCVLESTAVYTA